MSEGYRSSPNRWPGVLLAAAALAMLLSIAACSRAAATSDGAVSGAAPVATLDPSPSPASSTTANPETPVPQHSAVTSPSSAATTKQNANPGYGKALAQWSKGATAISAQQGVYWLAAAGLLQAAEGTDGGNTSGYQVAANELRDLAALPDAQQTPAQNADYHHDIDALNSFFGTPGLYS